MLARSLAILHVFAAVSKDSASSSGVCPFLFRLHRTDRVRAWGLIDTWQMILLAQKDRSLLEQDLRYAEVIVLLIFARPDEVTLEVGGIKR